MSSTAAGTPSRTRRESRRSRTHSPLPARAGQFAVRRARGDVGHALAGKSPGECRPREPGPDEPSRTRPAASRGATASERRVGEAPRATSGDRRAPGATPDALPARACAQMPTSRHESVSAQAFTEVTRARVYLTFARGCRHARAMRHTSAKRRVRARPAPDSDPVRRQGPERGSTGGGGRPRSFSSGPPLLSSEIRRASRAMMISDDFVPGASTFSRRRRSRHRRGTHLLDSTHG